MASREDRYRALFDEAYPALVAYGRRRVPVAEVDDLVADVLLVAWRRLDDVPERDAMPWLYGVARNVLANRRRGDRRRLALVERARSQPARTPVASPEQLSAPVVRALDSLRAEDREIVELAAWEGLAPRELAVVLGCTPNAAALRLSRARRCLRAALTGSDPDRTGAGVEGRRG